MRQFFQFGFHCYSDGESKVHKSVCAVGFIGIEQPFRLPAKVLFLIAIRHRPALRDR